MAKNYDLTEKFTKLLEDIVEEVRYQGNIHKLKTLFEDGVKLIGSFPKGATVYMDFDVEYEGCGIDVYADVYDPVE